MFSLTDRISHWVHAIYPDNDARWLENAIAERIQAFRLRHPEKSVSHPLSQLLTEKDAILITYGDQFQRCGQPHLRTLIHFLDVHLHDVVQGIHILPFFPYSSDDGFSVVDYLKVDATLGDWQDIQHLKQHGYQLMFDAVINHISRESEWFQRFLRGDESYKNYFIVVDPGADLSRVVRPRALPLLTPVETNDGVKWVWTTFSEDQIDLNYANPQVALEIIDVLLFYIEQGADIIRLDAIAFLWKEIGASCIHLPQTHAMVKLWRAIFDVVAPDVLLITETNVPHQENVSYFGEYLPDTGKTDEAQLVYNFTLAPLTLHAFLSGNATKLSAWASTLSSPPGSLFFNFVASHDGIGVRPAEGILSSSEIQALVQRTLSHGGQVAYRTDPEGKQSVYELNITLYDFLNHPDVSELPVAVARFLASQSILLALAGIPGIYVHSLFGSHSCHQCYQKTGSVRSLNREKFRVEQIEALLRDEACHQALVFAGYKKLLEVRRAHKAFHPFGEQRILNLNPAVFAVLRSAPDNAERILCLTNVSALKQPLSLPRGRWRDLLGDSKEISGDVFLPAYGVMWLSLGQ